MSLSEVKRASSEPKGQCLFLTQSGHSFLAVVCFDLRNKRRGSGSPGIISPCGGLELCWSWSMLRRMWQQTVTGTKFERCHVILSKMKVLAAVGSAAALIATPALASKAHKRKAAAHDEYTTQTQRAHDGKAIYSWDGRYLGWDPDPNIRFQIMRDQNLPPD